MLLILSMCSIWNLRRNYLQNANENNILLFWIVFCWHIGLCFWMHEKNAYEHFMCREVKQRWWRMRNFPTIKALPYEASDQILSKRGDGRECDGTHATGWTTNIVLFAHVDIAGVSAMNCLLGGAANRHCISRISIVRSVSLAATMACAQYSILICQGVNLMSLWSLIIS